MQCLSNQVEFRLPRFHAELFLARPTTIGLVLCAYTELNYGVKLIRGNNNDRKQSVKNLCFGFRFLPRPDTINTRPYFQLRSVKKKNWPGTEARV